MAIVTIGDLYSGYRTIGRNAQLKSDVDSLTHALSTGRKPDLAAAVRGDFVPIAGIERDLASRSAYTLAAREAADFTAAAQQALGRISDTVVELAPDLLTAADLDPAGLTGAVGLGAVESFEVVVNSLNGRFADRALFAGAATDAAALAPPADILAALQAAVAGATTATDVETIVEAWFDPGGGFDTVAYAGSADPLGAMRVAEDVEVPFRITAEDIALRDLFKGLALGALVRTSPAGGDPAEQAELARIAGLKLLNAQPGLQALRAEVGSAEARIEGATVRTATETAALDLARANILEADAYETAVKLESTQAQLEALYAVTARSARLSFTEFMR